MRYETPFFKSLSIQWRVICALLMREILTRFGRHNIGFFWLFCEPMLFCCGVILIRRLFLHENIHGIQVVPFVMTGYSSILLWRNCAGRCCKALSTNFNLLYHRNVRALDPVISRILLEISGCAMAFVVMVLVFVGIGLIKPPYDWFEMMVGYLLGAWVSASLALLLVGLTEYSDVFERLWHPIAYFMLPISGLGFMVDWLPLKWQKWAMLVPMVNGLEVMREGYFGETVRCHYSMHNLVVFCLGSMLIGLTLIKNFARQIVPE